MRLLTPSHAIGALKSPISKWLARRLETWAYNYSDRIIGLSPGICDGIIQSGYPKERVINIPNSCDNEIFQLNSNQANDFRQQHTWLGTKPLVIYTGSLGYANQVNYLVKVAFHMVSINPEICFLVMGDGSEKNMIMEKAKAIGILNENFFMLSRLPKKEMPVLYHAATVCTSLFLPLKEMWSNSANKFFDALAAGKPLLINYGGWQAELLLKNGAGIVVPPDNPVVAAQQLNEFITDKERLSASGRAALCLAKDKFDRDKLYKLFEQVLLDVL